jgi:vanillate O-demethylase ferredoxin subunit
MALPRHEPGSHVALHIRLPDGGLLVRHYSLLGGTVTHDDPRHIYRIAVQREEPARGSAYIHAHFQIGTRLEVAPPRNDFALNRRDEFSLLIAGGIGVTPIYAMARSLARRRRAFQVVYAGRQLETMALREEIRQLTQGKARLHASETSGQLDLAALLQEQPPHTQVYVCGPGGMVEAARRAAATLGWPAQRVRSERFSTGSRPEDQAFELVLRQSGHRVTVGRDASILDALNAARIPVLWDCGRGECGLCPLPVVEADGPLDHRDRYLTPEEQAAGQLCICVSRVRGTRLVLDA